MGPDEIELVIRRLLAIEAPKERLSRFDGFRLDLSRASQDFVLLTLLCAWLVLGPLRGQETWEVVEFFSGKGRLSRLAAKAGFKTASFEVELDRDFAMGKRRKCKTRRFPQRSFMDFNGESGFAFLGF